MNNNKDFAISELDQLLTKVIKVHGKEHPELINLAPLYEAYKKGDFTAIEKASELTNHFTLPSDACPAYTRVFKAFKILEGV